MAEESPPAWFWLVYDSVEQNVPIFPAASMRQLPLHWRWRVRTVKEVLREVKFERACRAKAQGVFDLSSG